MNVNEALAAYALRKTIGDALSDEAKLDAADVRDALMDQVESGSAASAWTGTIGGRKVATACVKTVRGRAAATTTMPVVRDRAAFTSWLVREGSFLAQEFATLNEGEFLAYALDRRGGECIPGVVLDQTETPATPDRKTIAITVKRQAVMELVAERLADLPDGVAGLLGVGDDVAR